MTKLELLEVYRREVKALLARRWRDGALDGATTSGFDARIERAEELAAEWEFENPNDHPRNDRNDG